MVDADVPHAVGLELQTLLGQRLAESAELGAEFTHDIAERVAGFTQRGGHRFRARLVWWSLRACGGGSTAQTRAALQAAAALELIQTCALVHDDLMDRSSTRRGGPALHTDVARQYAGAAPRDVADRLGASAAVLAGDIALAWADDAMAEVVLGCGLPSGTARRLHDVWRALRTEMAAGQYLDVHGQATSVRTVARAIRSACLKSALYTVERPMEIGAVLAGADAATIGMLRRAGRCAGLAFQLRDDLDDVFADPRVTGKPAGGDLTQGKTTYLLAVTRALATAAGDRATLALLESAAAQPALPDPLLADVRTAIAATGARDLLEKRIERLAGRSRRHLAEAGLTPRPAARLDDLLGEITRTSGRASAGAQPRVPVLTGSRTECTA
ncbi:polyprenyl synthetase family protein [Streptomyces sp. PLK6-54]|uniref:Polyprenyl synthetase family protein n=2 Tax=Actinacidiphila acidipaludis TaxID=2873382 RepID=A0ABS7Q510_9ACTN|nr:polyprenyl synthetase family protein [Streptomyces acidipaludis]